MRNLISLFLIATLALMVFSGCSSSNASDVGTSNLTTVYGDFTPVIKVVDDQVTTLSFEAFSPGVAGDGYCIIYTDSLVHFLPEGQTLTLKTNQYYNLNVIRVFKTARGLIDVGEFKHVEVGVGRIGVPDSLPLPEIGQSPGMMLAPRIIPNFTKGNISIRIDYYQGPPVVADEVEVAWGGFIRSGIQPIYSYATPIIGVGNEFRLPDDLSFTNVTVRTRLNDTDHGRMLVSPATAMEFSR